MDYTDEQLETALRKLHADGRKDEAKVIATEILRRRESAAKPAASQNGIEPQGGVTPWFMGQSYLNPPSKSDVKQAVSMPVDMLTGPSQLGGGLTDWAVEGANKLGVPVPRPNLSEKVSRMRNQMYEGDFTKDYGTGAQSTTGLMQGLATAPMVGPRVAGAALQGLGIGAGLTTPDKDRFSEGNKAAATNVALNMLFRTLVPTGAEPEVQKLYGMASKERIPMTTGQATDNKALKLFEAATARSPYSSNIAQKFHSNQQNRFNEAATRRTGYPTQSLTPEYIIETENAIGKDIGALVGNKPIVPDADLFMVARNLRSQNAGLNRSPAHAEALKVADVAEDLSRQRIRNTDKLLEYRSKIRQAATKAHRADDPVTADAYQNVIDAIDNSIGRTVGKDKLPQWLDLRKKYANLQSLDDVMDRASPNAAAWNIPPNALWPAVTRSMQGGMSRGRSSMEPVARIGQRLGEAESFQQGGLMAFLNPMGLLEAPIYSGLQNQALQRALVYGVAPREADVGRMLLQAGGLNLNVDR